MNLFKVAALVLFVFFLGYGTAHIPSLQLPLVQVLHRWRAPAPVTITGPAAPIHILGIGWVGTRTPFFQSTVTFFKDVLQLPLTLEQPQFAEFKLTGGERLGVVGSRLPHTAFMKGPMLEFVVEDVETARTSLAHAGVQFIGTIHRDEVSGLAWTEFWGPDGYPYGLTSVTPNPSHPKLKPSSNR